MTRKRNDDDTKTHSSLLPYFTSMKYITMMMPFTTAMPMATGMLKAPSGWNATMTVMTSRIISAANTVR